MKISYSRPASPAIVTWPQMRDQLHIDIEEQGYITDLVDAATEFAEIALATSLLTRTITAIHYSDNPQPEADSSRKLFLPRGPVRSVTTVTDANSNAITYKFGSAGAADYITLTATATYPVTVVYSAGYGTLAADIPADIRMAIRTHVASLWTHRESVTDAHLMPVPHSLADFYQLRRRSTPVA